MHKREREERIFWSKNREKSIIIHVKRKREMFISKLSTQLGFGAREQRKGKRERGYDREYNKNKK